MENAPTPYRCVVVGQFEVRIMHRAEALRKAREIYTLGDFASVVHYDCRYFRRYPWSFSRIHIGLARDPWHVGGPKIVITVRIHPNRVYRYPFSPQEVGVNY